MLQLPIHQLGLSSDVTCFIELSATHRLLCTFPCVSAEILLHNYDKTFNYAICSNLGYKVRVI